MVIEKLKVFFLTGSNADYVKTTNFTFDQGRFYSEVESNALEMLLLLEVK